MIEISLFTFLAILEGIVVLLIVIGVLVWRQRAARAKDRIAYIDGSDAHPTPALYLESEVAKTRTHLDTLSAESAAGDVADAQPALSLRAALLEVEAELSSSLPEERTRDFWQGLAKRLDGVLTTAGFNAGSAAATAAQAAPVPAANVEDASAADIVQQQSKTIDYLRNYIQELLDQHGHLPSPEPNISEKFDYLERANKELSGCVEILEDENEFLREQIAALLKL
jgi:hypothetical protein